jgi:hypothetical protein
VLLISKDTYGKFAMSLEKKIPAVKVTTGIKPKTTRIFFKRPPAKPEG